MSETEQLGEFHGRYPAPEELLTHGGLPGFEYALVAGENASRFKGDGWELVRQIPVLTVIGPDGEASVLLMGKGERIPGADPSNGVRVWWVDPALEKLTGIPLNPEVTPTGADPVEA